VRQAAATADSASISTPVRSTVRTVAVTSSAAGWTSTSTSTAESAMGWQSGMRSGVRFAAITPASRAAAITSPFSTGPARTSAAVAGAIVSRPFAIATRSVLGFAPTSIIFMGRASRSPPGWRGDANLRCS
jgi:hypothetical protein